MKQNDTLEWRARVGISLTEDEQSTYMSNIETFTTNIEQALSEQTLAAEMTVKEFDIKMADGSSPVSYTHLIFLTSLQRTK